jgi:hypothetical protein
LFFQVGGVFDGSALGFSRAGDDGALVLGCGCLQGSDLQRLRGVQGFAEKRIGLWPMSGSLLDLQPLSCHCF